MTSAFYALVAGVIIVFSILIGALIWCVLKVHRTNKKIIEQAKKRQG